VCSRTNTGTPRDPDGASTSGYSVRPGVGSLPALARAFARPARTPSHRAPQPILFHQSESLGS
jgi:hypothetical protein